MKLKLAETDSGFATSFFNMNKESIEASDVDGIFTKGTKVRALIQCIGFWIAAGKFGLSWKLKQMLLDPPTRIGKAYAFDDDEEESAPAPVQATKAAPVPVVEEAIVDEDEEDAQEVVPEPAQAKKVVRRAVVPPPKK